MMARGGRLAACSARHISALLATFVALTGPARDAPAQTATAHAGHAAPMRASDSVAEAAFIESARAATARYRDIAIARADGYRRLGTELPSLGEHWVHNGRALADTLDPAAPPILVYAHIAGRPTLAGVAYTRFLAPGEPYPDFPTGVVHAWHDHNGGVDDEVLPLGHLSSAPVQASGTRLRIAVMHAWIWLSNPAGTWTSDNWGLPYARLGLAPDFGRGGDDARAASLATGAAEYYLRAILAIGALETDERHRVEWLISSFSQRAMSIVEDLAASRKSGEMTRPSAPVMMRRSAADERGSFATIDALDSLWSAMWDDVAAAISPDAAARLLPLRAALAPNPTPLP